MIVFEEGVKYVQWQLVGFQANLVNFKYNQLKFELNLDESNSLNQNRDKFLNFLWKIKPYW